MNLIKTLSSIFINMLMMGIIGTLSYIYEICFFADDWDNWYIELYENFPCDNK